MVTQRTEGLYRVFLFCQIIIVAALFWFGVWIMAPGGALTWGRYSIYCGMLVLGLMLETLSRSKNFFLQNELLGRHDQLEQIIRDHGITQIILLEFPLFSEANQNVIQICDQLGIRLLILSDLEERLRHSVTHFEDGGFRFIGLREEPLENPLNRFLKRAIDIAIALPVMLVIFPVLAVIVFIAQRLQSPGPLFHVQNRAGMQNRQFEIYKFRTMHANNGELSRQAGISDERVYPLGKWFRKLSVDEVPQFWNVLLGDMSIVGPRPHLIEHN